MKYKRRRFMFVRNKNYENAIQKVRIDVGTLVGLEKDDEAYVVLKELPTSEMLRLKDASDGGESAIMDFFKSVLPKIITDHNFYETEQKKMTNEAVTEFIFEKLELSSKVISGYSNAAFFTQMSKREEK